MTINDIAAAICQHRADRDKADDEIAALQKSIAALDGAPAVTPKAEGKAKVARERFEALAGLHALGEATVAEVDAAEAEMARHEKAEADAERIAAAKQTRRDLGVAALNLKMEPLLVKRAGEASVIDKLTRKLMRAVAERIGEEIAAAYAKVGECIVRANVISDRLHELERIDTAAAVPFAQRQWFPPLRGQWQEVFSPQLSNEALPIRRIVVDPSVAPAWPGDIRIDKRRVEAEVQQELAALLAS